MSEAKIVIKPFPYDDEFADEWAPYIEDGHGSHVALVCSDENLLTVGADARFWSEATGIPLEL